jgi:RimJ/RimL family protein N-acetyltransferase
MGDESFATVILMIQQPTLETPRLILRPFTLADAPAVQRLAGEFAVADTTLHIPHPYPPEAAENWIRTHPERFAQGVGISFAIVLRETGELGGAIGLHPEPPHQRAEIGYWLGVPYWNRGIMTEAARAILDYGFTTLGLNRIFATHFTRNPASGRVMQKIGMTYEGVLRQHLRKDDHFEDAAIYSILRREWEAEAQFG